MGRVLNKIEELIKNYDARIKSLREEDAIKLSVLADLIKDIGEVWKHSGNNTEDYILKFSHWSIAGLHRQLGLATVRYKTNFDAAQVAFFLRICRDLQSTGNPESKEVTSRGLEVLFDSQEEDGTWPLGAPLAVDQRTQMAVHVANLEIINAVMPLLEEHGGLARYDHHLDRIFTWLITNRRRIKSKNTDKTIIGWSTDRILERARVDVWMSALGLEFLSAYRRLLQGYINDQVLTRKYDVKCLADRDPLVSGMTDPLLSEPFEERVTSTIYRHYIETFSKRGQSDYSSLILYGPPGTAKTTFAEAIAHELNWRLVTITPSDFVKQGIEMAESMARSLFRDLEHLSEVVILFDEIDEMLRSRDERNGKPERGMLQFLVPGMLPKLQNLKKLGETRKIIFIIATNYRERLDSAITRRGRIDKEFLIPPPDERARCRLLFNFLKKKPPLIEKDPSNELGALRLAAYLALRTGGWVYKELEALVWTLSHPRHKQSIEKLVNGLEHHSIKSLLLGDDTTELKDYEEEAFITPPKKERIWEGFRFFRHKEEPGMRRALDLRNTYGTRVLGELHPSPSPKSQVPSAPSAFGELREVLAVCHPRRKLLHDNEIEQLLLAEWRKEGNEKELAAA
jgi:adenylate kinase family enzyme